MHIVWIKYLCSLASLILGISLCAYSEASTLTTASPEAPKTVKVSKNKARSQFPMQAQEPEDTETLAKILQTAHLLEQMKRWNGKALVIKVDESQGSPKFQPFSYRATYRDSNRNKRQDEQDQGFFHPASTVKVAIASLVLEQLKQRNLGRAAEYRVAGASAWTSIEADLIEMLVVSNNDAANRLILLLGFQYLNDTIRARGLKQYAVTRLMLNQGTLIDSPPIEIRWRDTLIKLPKRSVSNAFDCDEIDEKSGNCASAHDLAGILMRVVYPSVFSSEAGFDLRPADRQWLQQTMSQTPEQVGLDFEDTFCRFLHPLGQQLTQQSGRLLSKCGIALFSHTYLETSYLETDRGQKYFMVFVVTPPKTVAKARIIRWLNATSQLFLKSLTEATP